jgi:hydroxymethylbilane synthase
MRNQSIIIATRESPLALWQAKWVQQRLEKLHPNLTIQLLGITTYADNMLSAPLYKLGGKGLFVKELEEALFDGRADIAVHSMKDVPMDLPEGLVVPVLCERESPFDVLASIQYSSLDELPKQAKIGTSSLRRQSQLLALRPDLQVAFLRGNVNTRINKLKDGEFAALILAEAGLKRLNLESYIKFKFTKGMMLPAAGQGVLGIECRENDLITRERIAPLNDINAFHCVSAERALTKTLEGGCHSPIAAYAELQKDDIHLQGLVGAVGGQVILRAEARAPRADYLNLGKKVANDLLAQGAKALITST